MRLAVGRLFPFRFDSTSVRLSADRLRLKLSVDPFANSATVLVVTVLGFTDSEKVITICPLVPTPVAPSLGVTAITVGAVASGVAAVVKLLLKLWTLLLARSVTPPTDTLTLALPGSGVAGVIVTVAPPPAHVPATT